jgi:hypothetical protein
MNVCLVDIDSKMPNLALMRASAWHKERGDSVKLGYTPLLDDPDLCYASKMFDFTPEPEYLPVCETLKGGPGYSLEARMPFDDYDRIMPDYSLYGCEYAIGRFSRGCPNRCPWCVVPKMDGDVVRKVADLEDFWDGQGVVRLLDDNLMVDDDLFCDACGQLEKAGVDTVFEALDIRLVTDRTAQALAGVKATKRLHFAWDSHAQDDAVPRGIETLGRHGIRPWRLTFYVLVGFDSEPDYDLHRIRTIHHMGANPFVMPFDKSDPYQRHLARWCNGFVFKVTAFDDYEPWVKERKQMQ